ncbi:MAG: NACHT domain-containing protein [Cyanobacteria bacterium P01_F01_bin.150]
MSFPKPFLIALSKEKALTEREQVVLIALLGEGKARWEIAEQLHIQESAISTCLSGVYKKFSISGRGPVKESRLKDELARREKSWQAQQETPSQHSQMRSRKLTLTDWTATNNAFMQYFDGDKSKLEEHLGMSSTTVNAFFNQKPVDESSFHKICLSLRLNWKQVSSANLDSDVLNDQSSTQEQSEEGLLMQVQQHCRQKILEQHSRMRLLSGKEIGVDQLYVDVWVLKKPESRYFQQPESLLRNFDIKKDRLALGKRIQRNPGFEIATNNSKLIILGKPGSGKTTFLKHLAIDWCKGKFLPNSIAILIELRKIQDSEWSIWNEIDQIMGLENWEEFIDLKKRINSLKRQKSIENIKKNEDFDLQIKELQSQLNSVPLHSFLQQGKLLVLMDGLDEAATNTLRHNIQDQLREASQEYPKNNFILTCRTQIMKLIPGGFTSVEVADFSPNQVRQFVLNWFTANGQTEFETNKIWKKVHSATNNQPDLRELTATPVLLSLICLVLEDERGQMPTDRGWLYKKGIKLLLSSWNDEKEIKGWEVGTEAYRQLSIERKEALLTDIAAHKFETPNNFVLFEQDELVKQVSQKLQLSNLQEGIMVLKAIETQHGLLIERADELWSFSHLTFQEYFTVQWLTNLPPQQLAEKIANAQWKYVVEQLVKSQQPADRLLRLVKQAIDQCISQEPTIQTFLCWLLRKSVLLQTNYKPEAIRAFYCSLVTDQALVADRAIAFAKTLKRTLDRARDYVHAHAHALNPDQVFVHALDIARDLTRGRTRARISDRALDCDFADDFAHDIDRDRLLNHALERARDFAFAFNGDFARDLDRYRNLNHAFECARDFTFAFNQNSAHFNARSLKNDLDRALTFARTDTLGLSPDWIAHLRQLKNELPTSNSSEEIQHWWTLYGTQWNEQLCQRIIEYRNISHYWQFTQSQQKQLQRYYRSNKFLVDLMKIKGAISDECRTEIEEGLLLPWAELQRRQPHVYGEPDGF